MAPNAVTSDQALRAGFETLGAFAAWMSQERQGQLYRIAVRYLGADPRLALREEAELERDDLEQLEAKLNRLDGKAPWVDACRPLRSDRA